jgi:putative salt-induced outer membrane protein YdiY
MKHSRLIRGLTVIAAAAVGTVSLYAQDAAATPPAPPAAAIQTNAPPPKPKPKWESALTASLTLTRGNSATMLASLQAKTEKKWESDELKFGVNGSYGETTTRTRDPLPPNAVIRETTVNVNAVDGYAQYNRLFSERLYGLIRVDGIHDEISAIDYRATVSPGLGYYFIKKPATSLNGEIGPSYVWERLDGVEDNHGSLRLADGFSHKFNDRAKIWQKTEVLPSMANFSHVLVNSEIGISASLSKNNKLALTSTLTHSYNSHPGGDITQPARMKNDFVLKTGITYVF